MHWISRDKDHESPTSSVVVPHVVCQSCITRCVGRIPHLCQSRVAPYTFSVLEGIGGGCAGHDGKLNIGSIEHKFDARPRLLESKPAEPGGDPSRSLIAFCCCQ